MGCQIVQYKPWSYTHSEFLWKAVRINYYAIDSAYFMRGVQQTGMIL